MDEFDRSSDRDLIRRFRDGDRDAFAVIYRLHHAAVFRFALYMTGDRSRAAEITQEAFVWLIHHPREFDPERGDLPAFLGGVARKFLRRQQQRDRRWLPLDRDAVLRLERTGGGVPREILEAEEAADLWKALASLPEQYREVVVLCDLEEMSNQEAAQALGCAVGTVWSRLHRAHGLLLRKLTGRKENERCAI